jgi:drug/metabolite transporter (DMT)-like permease
MSGAAPVGVVLPERLVGSAPVSKPATLPGKHPGPARAAVAAGAWRRHSSIARIALPKAAFFMPLRTHWLGILCGLLTALIWGVQSVVSRHAMLVGLTPADVTILRYLTAAVVLLPWALKSMRPFPVGALGWRRAWTVTLLIGPPYSLLLVAGVIFAPALHSSLVTPGLIPVFTALLIFLVSGERAGRMRLAGLGVILVGIAIFSRDALAMTPSRPDAWIGDLIFVLLAVVWSIFGLLARR